CCHTGRTPPCTEAIISAGLARVVIPCTDPNPLVRGRGLERLRAAGIATREGVLAEGALRLNRAWLHYVATGRPYVTIKAAQSLDGKTAAPGGEPMGISGPVSRALVHRLRGRADAVMVGVGTVIRDDPLLTTRLVSRRNALRVIVDSGGRTLPDSRCLTPGRGEAPAVVAVAEGAQSSRLDMLKKAGAEIWVLPADPGGRVDLTALMEALAGRGVVDLLCEAGGTLNAALLRAGLVSRILLFISPLIIGGPGTPTAFDGPVGAAKAGPETAGMETESGRPAVESAAGLSDDPVTNKVPAEFGWRRVGRDLLLEIHPVENGAGNPSVDGDAQLQGR
ncbi:MAG: bifunctional diaminohydroxyphosphoribosylaminopyrimidine deaminase/5-amino-6-(5-phosphoribosylamino)uracil reductase RibD, partial [Firmicutes bacterium]|nr:bifunctional diaminohydroxyphosphoribosylaminopyrimidine deaminase/5-amino-6-(5-phosphoribosylamino)uracil reductase RibD [Bacillota bacterium]